MKRSSRLSLAMKSRMKTDEGGAETWAGEDDSRRDEEGWVSGWI